VKLALVAVAVLAACEDKPRETLQLAPVIVVTKSEITYNHEAISSRQMVTAIIDDWNSTRATLQLWSRGDAEAWQPIGDPWTSVIGHAGAAWGTGLHEDPKRPGPRKVEGDGRSPAGAFAIRAAYGYAPAPPPGSRLLYTPSDRLECVDDPSSKHYTKIVDGAVPTKDWKSSEPMRLSDHQYTWVVDLGHNPGAKPGDGSCIFFHVWSDAKTATVGCTAMAEHKLVELMKQVDPAARPVYVLLPRAEYHALKTRWDLP
jgi:D-alanyl-D-alanine dipeptidase